MSDGDAELLTDMWKSMEWHVANVHTGHPGLYTHCAHGDLGEMQWLVPGTPAHQKFAAVVMAPRFLKGIRQLAPSTHTFSLEAFHIVLIGFAPKSVCFSPDGMRTSNAIDERRAVAQPGRPTGCEFQRISTMVINEQQSRLQPATPVTTLLPSPRALYTTGDVWQNWKAWGKSSSSSRLKLTCPSSPKNKAPNTSYYLRFASSRPGLFALGDACLFDIAAHWLDCNYVQRALGTLSPVTVVQPADTPRVYTVATEDGRQLQRTRDHLRPTLTPTVLSEDHVTLLPLVRDEGASVPSESTEL
ncbi:hypothetical protein HPB52_007575 [Rhipicephalus sanguineus]|uniref:Uncharacterized protein n=1 Tax=Rhipicephalus sanguineus TaxID=34632 RepID=A0A9D4SU28_RHISA|nr:hypothetical protein HPB52_007575 [Rhipicephalus sanguineus]